mmetsp:Transcript_30554/g.83964  ORF Transcript_30554/g.83964 Transcript_30554/m.83964 type:complete len:246 (+) Transcript_30554:229-966(+)
MTASRPSMMVPKRSFLLLGIPSMLFDLLSLGEACATSGLKHALDDLRAFTSELWRSTVARSILVRRGEVGSFGGAGGAIASTALAPGMVPERPNLLDCSTHCCKCGFAMCGSSTNEPGTGSPAELAAPPGTSPSSWPPARHDNDEAVVVRGGDGTTARQSSRPSFSAGVLSMGSDFDWVPRGLGKSGTEGSASHLFPCTTTSISALSTSTSIDPLSDDDDDRSLGDDGVFSCDLRLGDDVVFFCD